MQFAIRLSRASVNRSSTKPRVFCEPSFHAKTSKPFRFGVKSLNPSGGVVHLNPDVDLRAHSFPQQERM